MKQQIRRLARLQLVETELRRVRIDLAAVPEKIAALEEGKTAVETRAEAGVYLFSELVAPSPRTLVIAQDDRANLYRVLDCI